MMYIVSNSFNYFFSWHNNMRYLIKPVSWNNNKSIFTII